jgi:hypothetical protein
MIRNLQTFGEALGLLTWIVILSAIAYQVTAQVMR